MKTIQSHIKSGELKQFYLLCGKETYLKLLYMNRLLKAMLPEGSEMNLSRYEGAQIDLTELLDTAEAAPMFAERRVILVMGSGWFSSSAPLLKHLPELPDSTCFIFVEDQVEKSSKLYKYIKEHGYVSEMDGLDESNLRMFVAVNCKEGGCLINNANIDYLIGNCGTDLSLLNNEIDKLCAYCKDRNEITKADIDTLCVMKVEGKIFEMMDALIAKDEKKVMRLYRNLVMAQEKPMVILYMLIKACYQLYLTLSAKKNGLEQGEIAKMLGMNPYAVGKYMRLQKQVSRKSLRAAVTKGQDIEYRIKIGDLEEAVAVPVFVSWYCTRE